MGAQSISSVILSVFEEGGPEATMTVREIVDAVRLRYEDRNRVPNDNEIRGRLSTLHKEGVLERPARGQYTMVRAEPEETNDLSVLVDIISKQVRPSTLRRSVIWDATPYLHLAEDGGPGTRLVVEHKQAASLQEEVAVAWPEANKLTTWSTKTPGPLGRHLWEPDASSPNRISMGIVFVEREKPGATGLTDEGYRTPFPERILVEFLGKEGPPEAATIVRSLLQDPTVNLDRLWSAAETMGTSMDLSALLAGLGPELHPELRDEFMGKFSPVTQTLLRGER